MKLVKIVLVACALSAAAAHAQTTEVVPQRQAPHAADPRDDSAAPANQVDAPPRKADTCVGPVSFCNIYFGS